MCAHGGFRDQLATEDGASEHPPEQAAVSTSASATPNGLQALLGKRPPEQVRSHRVIILEGLRRNEINERVDLGVQVVVVENPLATKLGRHNPRHRSPEIRRSNIVEVTVKIDIPDLGVTRENFRGGRQKMSLRFRKIELRLEVLHPAQPAQIHRPNDALTHRPTTNLELKPGRNQQVWDLPKPEKVIQDELSSIRFVPNHEPTLLSKLLHTLHAGKILPIKNKQNHAHMCLLVFKDQIRTETHSKSSQQLQYAYSKYLDA